ncbi:MAG: ABC transporter ATP-binding protein [Bacteroidales bacterium]|jgi:ABC-type multidrug transport system ATPase subunit|nr:ABC transporter ATP-binding protein [Bacteroidales bacterium]
MVVAEHINKWYRTTQVLNDVCFETAKGEIFGLIGPDGAGKTTLFRVLTTLIKADSGRATIGGLDAETDYREIRTRIGYMPGRFSLYPDLTVRENLEFFATIFGATVRENYTLIEGIYRSLAPFENRPAGKLSGGMKQKLALSCVLIHKPSVLFLDEPATGVDPVSRKELWSMLRQLKEQGITIIVSTPYMDEALLCDRIALMQHGKLLSAATPAQVIAAYPRKLYAAEAPNNYRLLNELRANPQVASAYAFGDCVHVAFIAQSDTSIPNLREIPPGIEDCFIELTTGKGAWNDHRKNDGK